MVGNHPENKKLMKSFSNVMEAGEEYAKHWVLVAKKPLAPDLY